MSKLQILLDAPNCCGRGVQFKLLTPSEIGKVSQNAAKIVGTDATIIDLKKMEWLLGVKAMLCAVTVAKGLKTIVGKDIKWKELNAMDIDMEYDKLFGGKDSQVLEAVYRQYHEVSQSEVDAIVGKALPVSEG